MIKSTRHFADKKKTFYNWRVPAVQISRVNPEMTNISGLKMSLTT